MADEPKDEVPFEPWTAEDVRAMTQGALDSDPVIRDKARGVQETAELGLSGKIVSAPRRTPQSDLWGTLRALAKNPQVAFHAGRGLVAESALAAGKGAVKAGQETLKVATGAAAGASYHSGFYKLERDDQEEEEFRKWYENTRLDEMGKGAEFMGQKFDLYGTSSSLRQNLGETQGFIPGAIEGISQFTIGMANVGRTLGVLKGAPGVVGKATSAVEKSAVVGGALKGTLVDLTFFDPYEERLSNIIESNSRLANPVSHFLAAKGDDSEALARVKSAAEGAILGTFMDSFLWGLKALKARKAAASGEISSEEAGKVIQSAMEKSDEALHPKPGDAVAVHQVEGRWTLQPTFFEQGVRYDPEIGYYTEGPNGERTPFSVQKALPPVPEFFDMDFQRPAEQSIENMAERFRPLSPEDQSKYDAGLEEARKVPMPPEEAARLRRMETDVAFRVSEVEKVAKEAEAKERTRKNDETEEFAAALQGDAIAASESPIPMGGKRALSGDATNPGPRRKARGAPPEDSQAIFKTPIEAFSVADSINTAAKQNSIPDVIDPEQAKKWKEFYEKYHDVEDPRDAAKIRNQLGLQTKYVQAPEEVINTAKALVDMMPEAQRIARGSKTHADIIREAQSIFPGMSGEDVLEAASKMGIETDKLAAFVYATKPKMWDIAAEAQRLSAKADANPNDVVATEELAKALDTLFGVHAYFAETKANIARGLQAEQIPVSAGGAGSDASVVAGKGPNSPEGAGGAAQVAPLEKAAGEAAGALVEAERKLVALMTHGPQKAPKPKAEGPIRPEIASQAERFKQEVAEANPKETQVQNEKDLERAAENATKEPSRPSSSKLEGPAREEFFKKYENAKNTPEAKAIAEYKAAQKKAADTRKAIEAENARILKETEKLGANPPQGPKAQKGPGNPKVEGPAAVESWEAQNKRLAAEAAKENKVASAMGLGGHRAPGTHKATNGLSYKEIRALARNIFLSDSDPAAMLLTLRGVHLKKAAATTSDPTLAQQFMRQAQRYQMSAMLSGPITHATQAASSMMVSLGRGVETWYAGAVTGNTQLRDQGADILYGLWKHKAESWRLAKKSFMMGENFVDPANSIRDDVSGIGAIKFGGKNGLEVAENWLATLVDMPSRMLMASDEFFKQLNYRSHLRSQWIRRAREKGIPAEKLEQWVEENMEFAFREDGSAAHMNSLSFARQNTFTQDLDYGFGKTAYDVVQKHPVLRFVVPFVRTPVNVFRYSWERTPVLNRLNSEIRAMLDSGDPEKIAQVRARTELGGAIWATAGIAAYAGVITGQGPSDPDLRKQWIDAGNQPYSVKVGNRWVSYRKGDPMFTAMGFVADAFQVGSELSNEDQRKWAALGIAAMVSNLSNKTFVRDTTEFLSAITDRDGRALERILKNSATSFVPNLLKQSDPDDTMREARGWADDMMARVPGFSSNLEPRRNIFGEKVMKPPGWGFGNRTINPFTISGPIKGKNSIDLELLELGRGLSMPATTMEDGRIDLTDRSKYGMGPNKESPYERMMKYIANPPNGAPSLRQAVTRVMDSAEWRNLPDKNDRGPGGMKWSIIAGVVSRYQSAAKRSVLGENPELQRAYEQAKLLRAKSNALGQAGIDEVMSSPGGMLVAPKGAQW